MFFFFPKADHRILSTERKILKLRHHWIAVAPALLESVGLLLGLTFVSWLFPRDPGMWLIQSLLWYAMVFTVLRLAWRMAHWWDDVLVVTDTRFMRIRGVITSRTDMMPLSKMTDMTFDRSTMGLIFGYGSIKVESAGHDSLQYFRYVPFPEQTFAVIAALVFSKGLPSPKSPKPGILRQLRTR